MKALYRKYRPRKLSDVVGEAQVTDILEKALKSGKISHAYLFIGPRGCGKTSVARIFAHAVNNFDYELEDDYTDIIEIDAASNTGVDNIRELREKANIAPTKGKYKVYIIDEVHMLSKSAFNALLKTLEEPPSHVIFIMATTDAYKVPVTITSRAQTYTFKLADAATMQNFLKSVCEQEKIKITDDALTILVKRGGGSFRDSLSLLDQISTLSHDQITAELVNNTLGLPEDTKIQQLLAFYLEQNTKQLTKLTQELLLSGIKPTTIAEELIAEIIKNPTPSAMPLLSALSAVSAPFPEAKLLVALLQNLPATASVSAPAPVAPPTPPAPPDKIAPPPVSHFSWEDFLQKVCSLNDAIHHQLLKTTYKFNHNTLEIFPDKKITYSILSRANNKRILLEAGGDIKIIIHEAGEKPQNLTKDSKISQISGIMGAVEEVKNIGGSVPF